MIMRERVIWFVSPGMALNLTSVLRIRNGRRPVALVCFGGEIGSRMSGLSRRKRYRRSRELTLAQQLFVQTHLAADELEALGVSNTRVIGSIRRPAPPAVLDLPLHDDKGRWYIVYIGRVVEAKGIDLLHFLAAQLGPLGAKVLIAGPVDPSFQSAVSTMLATNPYLEYLGVLGADAVAHLLRRSQFAALLTSYHGEGVPGSLVEALAAGTPVLVTDHRAVTEVVEDGETGLVVQRAAEGGWDLAALITRLAALTPETYAGMRRHCALTTGADDQMRKVTEILNSVT